MHRQEDISGMIESLRGILARLDSLEFSLAAIKVQEVINMLLVVADQPLTNSVNEVGGESNL